MYSIRVAACSMQVKPRKNWSSFQLEFQDPKMGIPGFQWEFRFLKRPLIIPIELEAGKSQKNSVSSEKLQRRLIASRDTNFHKDSRWNTDIDDIAEFVYHLSGHDAWEGLAAKFLKWFPERDMNYTVHEC